MAHGRRNLVAVFVCLILSVIFHFTLLFAFSGVKFFQLFDTHSLKELTIYLAEETGSTQDWTNAARSSLIRILPGKKLTDGITPPGEAHIEKQNMNKYASASEEKNSVETLTDNEKIPENVVKRQLPENQEIKAETASKKAEPYQSSGAVKEKLNYDIFWLGVYVGKASLEAVNINNALRITSQVNSAPFMSSFYKVKDTAESWIIEGKPFNFRIKQQEGRYRSDKETVFDTTNRKIGFFNYLKGAQSEHVMNGEIYWDVISGFYYLRAQPLEVGKQIYINIFDSNKFYKAKIDVLKKEKVKLADSGEIDTIIVKPTLESEGIFQKKGDILIWLTDDEKRIPVRVSTKVPVGSIVAEIKYPFSKSR